MFGGFSEVVLTFCILKIPMLQDIFLGGKKTSTGKLDSGRAPCRSRLLMEQFLVTSSLMSVHTSRHREYGVVPHGHGIWHGPAWPQNMAWSRMATEYGMVPHGHGDDPGLVQKPVPPQPHAEHSGLSATHQCHLTQDG